MRSSMLGVALLATPLAAHAQAADPSAQRLETYFAQVQNVMKAGPQLGAKGRADRFEPIVTANYDNAAALGLVAGAAYAKAPPAERSAATAALARRGAVLHAANFTSFSGERFIVEPNVQVRGTDKLVRARIVPQTGNPATLIYRLRQGADGQWRILDVVSEGISQLALQRAEFAGVLRSGGLAALTKRLTELNAKAAATK